jgi:hypothetical protein
MFHYIDSMAFDVFYSLTGEGFVERHFVFSECLLLYEMLSRNTALH